jgi:acyl-CoA synthetase (AMP-forming)/AMP-acid ligase II
LDWSQADALGISFRAYQYLEAGVTSRARPLTNLSQVSAECRTGRRGPGLSGDQALSAASMSNRQRAASDCAQRLRPSRAGRRHRRRHIIADRLKDMVITGGENVYLAEVESVLYDHPAINEIAVIGLPDEQWGEMVVAVAAVKEGATVDLEELREFASERLARYKLPRRLEIVSALPRNPAGKVLKFELRARFGGANRA